ncbi:MAG: DUF6364 family protein [Propionibacteriaceae bacterium]|jgi:hypothetical protein|nr:DUF6364 family protein [Propionibacteriaceae bacterium]
MSNITLTMSPDLIRRAKILAASRDLSVSALVSKLLGAVIGQEYDETALWNREAETMCAGVLTVGPITWSRDEIHQR